MKSGTGKRFMALLLAAVLTICGIEFPPVNAYADTVETGDEEGSQVVGDITTIAPDETLLTYGSKGLDDGILGDVPDITSVEDLAFANDLESFHITMMVKYDTVTANDNQRYALFTLENDDGEFVTLWHNPKLNNGQGRLILSYKVDGSSFSNYYSKPAYAMSAGAWHKLSFSFAKRTSGNTDGCFIAIDGVTGDQGHNFASVNTYLAKKNTSKIRIGKKAEAETGINNFPGSIKYVECSSKKYDSAGTLAKNNDVPEALKNTFDQYVEANGDYEQDVYSASLYQQYATALENAQLVKENASAKEWEICTAYDPLKAAVDALIAAGPNSKPVAKPNVAIPLLSGRDVEIYAKDIATDADGDDMRIVEASLTNASEDRDKLSIAMLSDGTGIKVEVPDGATLPDGEKINITAKVFDGSGDESTDSVSVSFDVEYKQDGSLQLEYDLSKKDFNPKGEETFEVFSPSFGDIKKLSQMGDSLAISITLKFDASKMEGGNNNAYRLMEIADSANNYSEVEDNNGNQGNNPKSTLAVLLQPDISRLYFSTGAWLGSTAWQLQFGGSIVDNQYHTLTLLVDATNGIRALLDGKAAQSSTSDQNGNNKTNNMAYMKGFFGAPDPAATQYEDWRRKIDTITIGGLSQYSCQRHTAYKKFGGTIQSVVISDGAESAQSAHNTYGIKQARSSCTGLSEVIAEADALQDTVEADVWQTFVESDVYKRAKGTLATTHAADFYNNGSAIVSDLRSEIVRIKNAAFSGFGSEVAGMFDAAGDNTWLFGGGVETQGRFSEIGGMRNYVGQFEEHIRWGEASSGTNNTEIHRQRFMTNVGRTGYNAQKFDEKLDDYLKALSPKAVSYLVGPEDYSGVGSTGETAINSFKLAIQGIVDKALAVRDNTGIAVIQLPHAVSDTEVNGNVEEYAEAAKAALLEYVEKEGNADKKGRIVMVDHFSQTNDASFQTNNLTDDLLNGKGHRALAMQLSNATLGNTTSFPTLMSWEEESAPETYLKDVRPEVTAEAGGKLSVVIPDNEDTTGKTSWKYTLEVEDMEISGEAAEAEGRTLMIDELPEGREYTLCLQSSDGKVQLAKAYGRITAGEKGGAKELNELQEAIRAKVDADEALTWLFMGDSITHAAAHTYGYDGIAQTFEKYIKDDLGRTDDIVINTAVSSASTQSILDNIENRLNRYTPDIVSIMIGTNDAGSATNAATYETNLRAIVTAIREKNPDARIIFRTPTPSTGKANALENQGYLAAMKRVAEEDGEILYIDQYTEWTAEAKVFPYLLAGTNTFDYGNSLHPGTLGQLRMARQFIRECGLSTDTKIANLSYKNPNYVEEKVENLTPEMVAGKTRAALEEDMIAKLAEGREALGSVEVTLTDETNHRTYRKTRRSDSAERFILNHLANTDNRTYKLSIVGTAKAAVNNKAKKYTFTGKDVLLSSQNEALPFMVEMTPAFDTYLNTWTGGTTVGTLREGAAAQDGTYRFEFVDGNNDNEEFTIEGNLLKVKSGLEEHRTYKVDLAAVNENDGARSQTGRFEIKTLATLEAIRKEARDAFADDQSALDLDLSDVVFNGSNSLNLADENGAWYQNGDYLKVLNNLREKTTGGTIIYQFRAANNVSQGLIFSTGNGQNDNNAMAFGMDGGNVRGKFRTKASGLVGNFGEGGKVDDAQWHTVAISFDTTIGTYQNQILLSVDGSSNVFPTDWWRDNWQSWFNVNPENVITHFEIGGGSFSAIENRMPAFNGNISFLTITDDIYSEEELKYLSQTPLISGEQTVSIDGTQVSVSEGAHYTASAVTSGAAQGSSFTLTTDAGYLFDDETSVRIANGTALGIVTQESSVSANGRQLTVTFSTQPWRTDTVFETGELTFANGATADGEAAVEKAVIEEKLGNMRRGSITVRYKLSAEAAASRERIALFGASNGNPNGYASFYIVPSTGTIGYEIRNQEEGAGESTTVNADSNPQEDIKNTNWHTITYIFDASGTQAYLDGVRVIANRNTGFLSGISNMTHAQVGSVYRGEGDLPTFPFSGEINLAQVTFEALNEDQVAQLHAATTADAAELPADAVKTDDLELFAAGEGEEVSYTMPGLLTTENNTLIAVADMHQLVSDGYGSRDTVIRRSADGVTWGDMQKVFDQPDGELMSSFTTEPVLFRGAGNRVHMIATLYPESQGASATGLIEKGTGFKKVGDKLYPILRDYPNSSMANLEYTAEYTIRENGVVYDEAGNATTYAVENYLGGENAGRLTRDGEDAGNIYIYTGENAGELKMPRVASLVTCYSDDHGATWTGYQNITGMVKEDWMKFITAGPGTGIRLGHQTDTTKNGRLIVPVCYTNGSGAYSYNASVIYSDDNGATWKMSTSPVVGTGAATLEEIQAGSFRDAALRESQIVEMNDGTLKLFSRNYSGELKVSTGTATDNGIEWSKIETTQIRDRGAAISVIHAPAAVDGKEAVILSTPLGPDTNNGYVYVGLYNSADGSFDWKYSQKIKSGVFANSSLSLFGTGSVGALYAGSNNGIAFTSMNMAWLTAPKKQPFTAPAISDITLNREGSRLVFTVTLTAAAIKKGAPTLKLKIDGADANAAYVSGNATNTWVFAYTLTEAQAEAETAVASNIEVTGFAQGAGGAALVNGKEYEFSLSVAAIFGQLQTRLETLKTYYDSNGKGYTQESWNAFKLAYENAQKAITDNLQDKAELQRLLDALNAAVLVPDETMTPEQLREIIERQLLAFESIYNTNGEGYTEVSWNAFKNAYEAAEAALDEELDDLDLLNEILDNLNTAKEQLDRDDGEEPGPDDVLDALKKALEEFEEEYNTNGEGYDPEKWEAFEKAYEAAQDAIRNNVTDTARLQKLLKDLQEAQKNLGERPGTTEPGPITKPDPDEKPGPGDTTPPGGNTPQPTAVKLAAPEIASLKAVAEKKAMGVKITVQPVTGADSYTVYRLANGKTTEIGNAGASGVIYDQNPVSKKEMSYYAVAKSADPNYTASDNGAAKKIKLTASVKKLKAKQSGKRVRISYKKLKGAKKYYIYRSMKPAEGFVRIGATKKTSFIDKKAKKGKTYYYRVVVKTKKGFSGYAASKAVKMKKK